VGRRRSDHRFGMATAELARASADFFAHPGTTTRHALAASPPMRWITFTRRPYDAGARLASARVSSPRAA